MTKSESTQPNDPTFGLFVFALLVSILASLWKAYVFFELWGWFAVPLGLPEITYWHAFGLATLMIVAVYQMRPPKRDEETSYRETLRTAFFSAGMFAFALGYGAVAVNFMNGG